MGTVNPDPEKKDFVEGPASQAVVSLSQAILGPLDAIFKAQIHSARSFLSFLLQIGYPHQPLKEQGKDGTETPSDEEKNQPFEQKTTYNLDFYQKTQINGKDHWQMISVPALALVPIAPIAIESGQFIFDLNISYITNHQQIQKSESSPEKKEDIYNRTKRPWFLVDEPISIRGHFAPSSGAPEESGTRSSQEAKMHIEVKIGRIPMPSGLDKLLTSLTQVSSLTDVDKGK